MANDDPERDRSKAVTSVDRGPRLVSVERVGRTSRSELEEIVADSNARAHLIDVIDIGRLIERCVIPETYRLSDDFARTLGLSALGEQIVEAVAAAPGRTKPNDLRMAVFLSVACSEGLLIDPETDLEAIRTALSAEVEQRRLLYPFIYGRDLHDLAVERFPKKVNLSWRDTVSILHDLPIGVFQNGTFTVGPFGCLRTVERRQLLPDYRAPGYLCEDVTCGSIHPINLSTSQSSISKTRSKVAAYIQENHAGSIDENKRLIHEAGLREYGVYGRRDSEALIDTLADGFEIAEVRHVVNVALRLAAKDEVLSESVLQQLGIAQHEIGSWVGDSELAELLQGVLLVDDSTIAQAIDIAVRTGQVEVGEGEVRRHEIVRHRSTEFVEVGRYGVRWRQPEPSGYVASRLHSLLHHLYFGSSVLEPADLAYRMSLPESTSESELLGAAISSHSPEHIVTEMVLHDRRAAQEAENLLGIREPSSDRKERLATILWKLGVALPTQFGEFAQSIALLAELETAMREGARESDIRSVIANLFASVETVLQTSLIFAIQALTEDHFVAADGFTYDHSLSPAVLQYLDVADPIEERYRLELSGKNTLGPLGHGFARLSAALGRAKIDEHLRPTTDWPPESRIGEHPFAFPSCLPFLNLTLESQRRTLADLSTVSSFVQDPTLLRVRNAGLHGNSDFPTSGEIESVARDFARYRSALWVSGLYPRTFSLSNVAVDPMGRQTMTYSSDGESIDLLSPTWVSAPKLPLGDDQLVVVPAARLEGCGPLRFVIAARPGRRDYWRDWPVRWESESAVVGSDHAAARTDSTIPMAS